MGGRKVVVGEITCCRVEMGGRKVVVGEITWRRVIMAGGGGIASKLEAGGPLLPCWQLQLQL